MSKRSAGILVYRYNKGEPQVLLGHPGGPFWAKKDEGVWSIPKGLYEQEDAQEAAQREFNEETGFAPPKGGYTFIGEVTKPGKILVAWAAQGDYDPALATSNTFSVTWPPLSGRKQEFPEIDRVAWFDLATAKTKISRYQLPFIERLEQALAESQ